MGLDSHETQTLSYSRWLLKRHEDYDIKLIIPEDFNSEASKQIVMEMIEDAYEVEYTKDMDNEHIDALFNLEVSMRILDYVEEQKMGLVSLYNKSKAIEEDKDKLCMLSDKDQEVIIKNSSDLKEKIKKVDDYLDGSQEILDNEDIRNDFFLGNLYYADKRSDEQKAKDLIAAKELEVQDKPDTIKITFILNMIDEAIEKATMLIERIDLLLNMDNKEVVEETQGMEEALSDESKKDIESRAVVVADNSDKKEEAIEVKVEADKKIEAIKPTTVKSEDGTESFEEKVDINDSSALTAEDEEFTNEDFLKIDPKKIVEAMQEKTFSENTNAYNFSNTASKEIKEASIEITNEALTQNNPNVNFTEEKEKEKEKRVDKKAENDKKSEPKTERVTLNIQTL